MKARHDGPGFWLPNDLIDKHLEFLSIRGLALYVILARYESQADYPNVSQLAEKTGLQRNLIKHLIGEMFSFKLLNSSDLKALGLTEEETV